LGRRYRDAARSAITTPTQFGGFANTACWPPSALLVTQFRWRSACAAHAARRVGVLLPVYILAL
jgi:hypothetical protein